MADTAAVTAAGTAADSEPSERGRLVVHDRAVERLATHAAVEVPGVARYGDPLSKALGKRLPRISAQVSGRIAAIEVDLAVAWGSPLDDVAVAVRQTVRDRLQDLAGLTVTRVDVTVKRVVREAGQEARVR